MLVDIIDLDTQRILIDLYNQMEGKTEISIGAPNYDQSQIDIIIANKYLKAIDASSLEGWAYIISPTYMGKKYVEVLQDSLHYRVCKFIKRGEDIEIKEKHEAMGVTTVSGPLYNAWMDEINMFNERNLKKHPMYNSIHTTYFQKKNRHSFDDMMGHLRALASDDELDSANSTMVKSFENRVQTFDIMLEEDIEKCESYLNNPIDEEKGINLYIEITGKYDAVIPSFGLGLYQYIPEQHFYDSDISGETLKQNLLKLVSKMKSFQRTNGYKMEKKKETVKKISEEKHAMSNKVFIVHGHDELAVQEMARTLEKWGFKAIILHEQADMGLTIIEKIEKYTDVDYAVVLYTECDYGRAKEASVDDEKYRARQNVVFEHGYLISKLHRGHVCALVKGDVETPGDISGVVYVPMDDNGAWKMALAKNMKAAGINIDMDKFLG